jgi:predicted Zn finger-like uncharacterized protein
MALATQCPHCATTFRVASDQLKLRGGIVRCGACHEIFDGNAALIDLDALPAVPAQGSAPPQETPTDAAHPAPDDTATDTSPVVPAQAETHADEAPPAATDAAPDVSPVVPAQAGTHTDEAHPAPNEAATDAGAVVPAQAGTHADDAHPAPNEAATDTSPVVPAQAGTHADEAHPAPAEAATDAGTVVPAQAGTPFDATAPVTSAEADLDSEPIYTLDFDRTFDPFGILPKAAAPEALETPVTEAAAWSHAELSEPARATQDLAPQRPIAPELDLPIDEELIAAPLPGDDLHDPEPAAAPAAASAATTPPAPPARAPLGSDFPYTPAASIPPRAGPRTKPGRRSKLTPTKIAAPKLRVPEIDEPEFVKRSRQQEQTGKTRRILMAVGSAVLLLALAAQAVTSFRNVWAARFPAAKPALVTACALLGCRVQLPTQIDNLAIETGELQTLGATAYSLTTQLRNNGDLVQGWPNIELALTDANDKPLLRRVFTPAEYLAPGARPGTGFAPRAEQPIKLYFELDQLKPSGYHIAIFYP